MTKTTTKPKPKRRPGHRGGTTTLVAKHRHSQLDQAMLERIGRDKP